MTTGRSTRSTSRSSASRNRVRSVVVRGNERVDEHDRVLGFPVDAPDVLLPVVGRSSTPDAAAVHRQSPSSIRVTSTAANASGSSSRTTPCGSGWVTVLGMERPQPVGVDAAAAAERAVAEERQRIARELHDVVAHSVSVMTVQAGAVRRLLRPEQERERQALEAVEATGREALTEMRRLVGLLRERGTMPEFAPQPSMRTVDVLVGTVREAGPLRRARGRG